MNKQKNMQTIVETNSLQNMIINEVCQKIFEAAIETENALKDKYVAKQKLIEIADDMTTQEKLDAMDKNYGCRNQELRQNMFYFSIVLLSIVGVAVVNPIAIKMYVDFYSQHKSN